MEMEHGMDRLNKLIARRTTKAEEFVYVGRETKDSVKPAGRRRAGIDAAVQTYLERAQDQIQKLIITRASPLSTIADSATQNRILNLFETTEKLRELVWRERGLAGFPGCHLSKGDS